MEIEVSSIGSSADFLHYRRTRFPLVRFLPLALFLTLATATTDETATLGRTLLRVLLVLLWLFQFRLADDLADLEGDRRDHPERVLVRAGSRPFLVLLVVLAASNTLLSAALEPAPRWVEFLALSCLFLMWYAGTRFRRPPRLLASFVVLLKYPAFVYLLSDHQEVTDCMFLGVLVLVYACFLAYEILHDRRLWVVPGSKGCLILALTAMTMAALWPGLLRPDDSEPTGWWLAGWIAPGCVVLAWLFRRHGQHRELGLWPYAVFLVSCVWITCNYLIPPHAARAQGHTSCFVPR